IRNENFSVGLPSARIQYVNHYDLDTSHRFTYLYDDESGIVTRTYFQPSGTDPNDMTPLETETRTDLAGRITEIYENSVLTAKYEYSDDITMVPAIVETKYGAGGENDGRVATQFWVDASGQIDKVVHLVNQSEELA